MIYNHINHNQHFSGWKVVWSLSLTLSGVRSGARLAGGEVLEKRGASLRPWLAECFSSVWSPHTEIKLRWQILPPACHHVPGTVLSAKKDLLNPHNNQSFRILQLGKLRLSSQCRTARKSGAGIRSGCAHSESGLWTTVMSIFSRIFG